MSRAARLVVLAGAASAGLSTAARGAQVLTSWLNPSSGFWSSAPNWSAGAPDNGSPAGATYDVLIDAMGGAHTVTLNTAATVDRLRVDSDDARLYIHALGSLTILTDSFVDRGTLELNGSLAGAGALTVNSSMIWNGGSLTGAGALNIGAAGSLTLTPSGLVRVLGRSLNNAGTMFGTGTTTLGVAGSPSVVTNQQSGVMNFTGLSSWNSVEAGSAFNNAGTVNVVDGTLFLVTPGQNSGRIHVAQGATLYVGSPYTHGASGVIDGSGEVRFNGGSHAFGAGQFLATGAVQATSTNLTFNDAVALTSLSLFDSGTTRFNSALSLESLMINGNTRAIFGAPVTGLKSVTAAGASVPTILPVPQLERLNVPSGQINIAGDLTITDSLIFGGTLVGQGGAGSLILAPTCQTNISGSAAGVSTFRNIVNHGSLAWHGSGGLQSQWAFENAATLHNTSSGVITTTGYTQMSRGALINDGTLIHLGSSTLATVFNNGSMRVEGGFVQMYGGTSTGAFHVEQGSRLELGATHVFASGARILGEGELRFTGGVHTIDPTIILQTPHVSVAGSATSTINTALNLQRLSMFAGSLTLNNSLNASDFASTGGVLIANGQATLGSIALSGGTVRLNAGLTLPSSGLAVNGGYLNLNNVSVEMASVALQAGGIGGTADLIVNDTLNWSSGTMYDAGRTIVAASGTLMIGPSGARDLRRTLENHGAGAWSGSRLHFNTDVNNSRGVFINRPGATLSISGAADVQVDSSFGITHDFTNEGVINSASTAAIVTGGRLRFNNHGTFNLLAGSLTLDGGGTLDGLYNVANGASLLVRSVLASGPGAALAGDGSVSITTGAISFGAGRFGFTGDLNLSGGLITITDHAALRSLAPVSGAVAFSNGLALINSQLSVGIGGSLTIDGLASSFDTVTISSSAGMHGSADLTFRQSLVWNGGTLTGTGVATIAQDATLSMTQSSARTLARRLDIAGTAVWSAGAISLSSGGAPGTMNVLPTGVLRVSANRTISAFAGAAIHNAGAFDHVGTDQTTINTAFHNAGSVSVARGALLLAGGGSHSGVFNIGPDGALELAGAHSITNPNAFQGVGGLVLKTAYTANTPLSFAGALTIGSGADVVFNAPATLTSLRVDAGALTLNAPISFSGALFNGGAVMGSSEITLSPSTTNWFAGSIGGSGRIRVTPDATLALRTGATKTLARALDNYGAAIWNAGTIVFGDASTPGVFNNLAGANFEASLTSNALASNSASAFVNAGSFLRVGQGTTSFSPGLAFNNHGLVDIQGGALHLLGGGLHSGAFNIAPAASFRLNGEHSFTTTSTIAAPQSAIEIAGGSTSFNGLATAQGFLINPGATLSGSGTINAPVTNNGALAPGAPHGGLAINGAYTQTAAASLLIDIFSPTNADRLTITGPASLAGTLAITLDTNLVTPQWGQSWTIASYASRSSDFTTFIATPVDSFGLRWWRSIGAAEYTLGLRHVADTNRDGIVDFLDLNNVLGTFGQAAPGPFGQLGLAGDANEDGIVDFLDLNLVLGAFGQSAPPATIPAPPTALLMTLASILAGRRRRRTN